MTSWLQELKAEASVCFEKLGIPNRHHEEWKYTNTTTFMSETFHAHSSPLFSLTYPKGAVVVPMAVALIEHTDKIKPFLGQILKTTHGFHAQNTALFEDGLFVYLPAGVVVEEPIYLSHMQQTANQASYVRNLIIAEPGACATIIEDYQGTSNTVYFTNAMTEVHLGANAHLTHYKIQREGRAAYHVSEVAVEQAANSTFDSHSFSVGGQWVRSDTVVSLNESGADCKLNGVYAPSNGQHIDHHTCVFHNVPNCTSDEDYKGILSGQSRAVFNGKVIVAKGADKTTAKQQNKNLLLSLGAEIDTKPELQIFADDVVCSHGATVGQLDETALFYLEARGIDPVDARRMLVQAFATDNLRRVTYAPIVSLLDELLIAQIME